MIHLALDDLPDWRAGAELRQFAYVHLAPSLDAMARTYQQAMAGMLPDEPVLVVGQPTAIDPSRAPPGKHVLWVQVRMLPAEDRRRCGRRDRARALGLRSRKPTPTACSTSSRRYAPGLARKDPRPRGVLADRSRARESRTWSAATRSAAAIISRRTSCSGRHAALPANRTPVGTCSHGRRGDLAGRRHRCGFRLHAREDPCRLVTAMPLPPERLCDQGNRDGAKYLTPKLSTPNLRGEHWRDEAHAHRLHRRRPRRALLRPLMK